MKKRPLSSYEKELARLAAARWGHLPADRLVLELCRIGVVDPSVCKILSTRRFVDDSVKSGLPKVEAMWLAAERFGTSYEYIRKCMYNYPGLDV